MYSIDKISNSGKCVIASIFNICYNTNVSLTCDGIVAYFALIRIILSYKTKSMQQRTLKPYTNLNIGVIIYNEFK